MKRRELVEAIDRLAFAAELEGDRRARALGAAAWALRSLDEDPRELVESGKLADVKGIGPKTAQLVADLLDGIRPKIVEELEAKVPTGPEMAQVATSSRAATSRARLRTNSA